MGEIPGRNQRQDVFTFAEEYRKFISSCKTERECAAEFYRQAKEAGFADLSEKIAQNTKLKQETALLPIIWEKVSLCL